MTTQAIVEDKPWLVPHPSTGHLLDDRECVRLLRGAAAWGRHHGGRPVELSPVVMDRIADVIVALMPMVEPTT